VALLLKSGEPKERKDFFTVQPKMPAAAEKKFSRGNLHLLLSRFLLTPSSVFVA